MSCLAGPTRHASALVFLTQVTKQTQHIGNHIGERYRFPPYLGLESTYFLSICLESTKNRLALPVKGQVLSWRRRISLKIPPPTPPTLIRMCAGISAHRRALNALCAQKDYVLCALCAQKASILYTLCAHCASI
jgi:hypothetical protein